MPLNNAQLVRNLFCTIAAIGLTTPSTIHATTTTNQARASDAKVNQIKEEQPLKPRTAEQAAQRIVAIIAIVVKVHEPETSEAWIKKHNLKKFLSPAELAFIENKSPTQKARASYSWRTECLAPLLWSLNKIQAMPPLNQQFSAFKEAAIQEAWKDPHAFIANAKLRPIKEINEMEAKLYHQHWRVRDAQLGGTGSAGQKEEPPISELNPEIVYERRYGISWLAGWGDDWDNVPTDT